MSDVDLITQEVRALERLDLEGLRAEWRRRYGPPSKLRSPDLVRRLLAWRIQVEAFGGLDVQTRRQLRRATAAPPAPTARPGTRLAREWKGVTYEVQVVGDGFQYAGRTFKSLSQVAREITGVRWNGPRFFGLRAEDGR